MSVAPMDKSLHDQAASGDVAAVHGFDNNGGKLVVNWTVPEIINWLNSVGFASVAPNFQKHSINGAALPKLNDALLKEMGIEIVGIRILLLVQIVKVQAIARSEWRQQVLWASDEYRAGPCNNTLPFGFPFPFEACVGRPDVYTLTNAKFNIMRTAKVVNTPCTGFCGFVMAANNLDLKDVRDVDATASTAMVGDPPGNVIVNLNDGQRTVLTLKSSQCQKVVAMVLNAKEEAVISAGMQAMAGMMR